jgi:hypothetical protein
MIVIAILHPIFLAMQKKKLAEIAKYATTCNRKKKK